MRMRLQICLVLLALVTASMQCVARCATVPCHSAETSSSSHLPPCHRQAPSKQHIPTEACQSLFLVDGKASPVFHFDTAFGDIAAGVSGSSGLSAFERVGWAARSSIARSGLPYPFFFSVMRI